MFETGYTRIFIDDVLVLAHVGCADWEKLRATPLLVSVELTTAQTEWPGLELSSLIDYMVVHDYIMSWPSLPHRNFLEQVGEELFAFCFTDPRIAACRVRLKKPHMIPNSQGVGVEMFRLRPAAQK